MSKLDYNEIGQLKTKNQGGLAGSPFLQSTNFGYNERGWMSTSTNSLFSTQLSYQENSSGQYNGNISKQSWGAGTNTSSAGVFSYGYDKLNRLLSAVSTGVVMSETITYDVMGNISTLKRDAGGANLYHYNGNRLDHAEYFTNIYAYDANGNSTTDGRKGYNIQYNQLNLPSVVSNGFPYNKEKDEYSCPMNKPLPLKGFHTTLDGTAQKIYRTSSTDCKGCPMKSTCVPNKSLRQITRTIYDEEYLRAYSRQHSKRGKQMKKLRQSTVEPVFGSLTQYYSLRKIGVLGKAGAHKVMLMAAIAFNLKKYLKKGGRKPSSTSFKAIIDGLCRYLTTFLVSPSKIENHYHFS